VELYLHFPNTISGRDAQLSTGTTLPYLTFSLPVKYFIQILMENLKEKHNLGDVDGRILLK
jgi:hypothetical protein